MYQIKVSGKKYDHLLYLGLMMKFELSGKVTFNILYYSLEQPNMKKKKKNFVACILQLGITYNNYNETTKKRIDEVRTLVYS